MSSTLVDQDQCPSDAALSAFIEGALPEVDAGPVRRHLASCEVCREVLREVEPSGSLPLWERVKEKRWSVGQQVGRYVLLSFVGAGGMGEVWAAWDPQLERRVALKRLAPILSAVAGEDEVVSEARALARFHHPNVVTVYEVLEAERCLVMAFVEGETLRAKQGRGGEGDDAIARWLEVARALAAAHAAGLVHRDVKPDNVLVEGGHARLMDFGLASAAASSGPLRGTPAYMAPEVLAGRDVGPAADQYAWAVSVLECLSGRREVRAVQGVPRSWRPLLARALADDPSRRWPSMTALLEAWDETRRSARRRARLASTLAIVGLLVGTALVARREAVSCGGGGAIMSATWGPAIRVRVKERLLANQHQAVFADNVLTSMDGLVSTWLLQHREACEATHLRREQSEALLDLRMACLERRRAIWGAHVEQVLAADARVTARALEATERLPSAIECGDPSALLRPGHRPGRVPARVRAEAERLIAESWSADGLLQSERWGELTSALRQTLEAGSDDCLDAEAELLRARYEGNEGMLEKAFPLFESAWLASLRCGDERLQQRVLISQARVMAGKDTFQQELGWAKASEALLSRMTAPAWVRHEQALAMADVHVSRAEYELADAALATVLEDPAARDSLAFVEAHLLWARSVLRQAPGSAVKAVEIANRGLEYATKRLGPDHPRLADLLQVRYSARHELGRLEASVSDAKEVLRLREQAYGPDSSWTDTAYYALSFVRAELVSDEEGVGLARHALERAKGKPPRRREALRELHLGEVLIGVGRLDEAAPLVAAGLATIEGLGDQANTKLPAALEVLVRLRIGQGRGVEALEIAERMVRLGSALWPRGTASQWRRETLLADAYASAGRLDEALGRYEQIATRFEQVGLGPWAFEARAHAAMARARAGRWPVAENVEAVEALRVPSRAERVWCEALALEAKAGRRPLPPGVRCDGATGQTRATSGR